MDDGEHLEQIIKKKMNTVMVGSLAIVEDELEKFLSDNPEIHAIIRKRIFCLNYLGLIWSLKFG